MMHSTYNTCLKIALRFFCFLLFPFNTIAQSDAQLNAFAQSYEYENTGNYAAALLSVKEVYDEKSYELTMRYAWLCFQSGLYFEAMNKYKVAIELASKSVEAKMGYIACASQLGNSDQVFEQYNKIIEVEPNHFTANFQLGLIYYNQKHYQVASSYFEKICVRYPSKSEAQLMYAWCILMEGKNKEKAETLFKTVLCLSPNNKSALEGLELIKHP